MNNVKIVDIILITYQRLHFLKKILEEINNRTFYPHRLIVVDNGSTDGTKEYLKNANKIGRVGEVVFLPDNVGQLRALNEGFKLVTSDYFVTTQDDLIPPDLRPCWLERLVHLFEKHYPDYGAICMRIQRTRRLEWNETDDIIENHKSMPSVFRIQKKSDFEQLGSNPFGTLRHWESHHYANTMRQLKKKFGMATQLYSDHIGFMSENKGYTGGFANYFTYSKERVKQGEEKPYPDIDSKTNIPLKINHPVDKEEHQKRLNYWESDIGIQSSRASNKKLKQREILGKFCEKGICIDIGCGREKCHPNCIGIDIFPYDSVDIVHQGDDLWFFKNGQVDSLIACHALEHFVDTKKTLTEWDRVLKIGGILAFIVPDAELRPKTIAESSHKVALTKQVIRALFKRVFVNYDILTIRNLTELSSEKAQKSILFVGKKNA